MMYTWIIVLGVIILAVILYAGKNGNKILKRENPLEILNRRYAKGDISKEEYEESKQSINLKK
ncbi:SHOCT domain-containing protein [uncultured Algibacter sp.]|uniref:SHOCT domain-containing protein n=1 Tax=uncultured Algibacter sp. TaxID=298659 RepID=UPI0030EE40F1